MQIFTGVLVLDAFAEYKTENGFSSIARKISSAKAFDSNILLIVKYKNEIFE